MNKYFTGANILLPATDTDMNKWSVVACDQFTSQPEYWKDAFQYIGSAPSTLNLILPECYLEKEGTKTYIENIHRNMNQLLNDNFFTCYPDAMIYVERTDSTGKVRCGLVGNIDLEAYDYHADSSSPVRPTEATVIERIPPRIKIRQNAPLESPHIMLLIDDIQKTVIEPLGKKRDSLTLLYDFDLMGNGGHIKGYLLDDKSKNDVSEALACLCDADIFEKKYHLPDKAPVFFATGDGNHSLATAKAHYTHLKRSFPEKDFQSHPARYALVELVNLHSPALDFEPIHRIVTNVDRQKLLSELTEAVGLSAKTDGQPLEIVYENHFEKMSMTQPTSKLSVGTLQQFLDQYLSENEGDIDYIHGDEVLKQLASQPNSVGFLLPVPQKEDLFPSVIADGALPRKTFSMGHADDKRYYLECRSIIE